MVESVSYFRKQILRRTGEKVDRMRPTRATANQLGGHQILGLQMREVLANSGGADAKKLLELLDGRLAVAL